MAEGRTPALLAAALAMVGIGGSLIGYWPGLMSWDAERQYEQALSGKFDDWHPPAMEWLWRQLIPLHPGTLPMLALQLALLWIGLGLIACWAWRSRRPWLAPAVIACALMPISIGLMGAVLKDCLMTGAIMVACGILALVGDLATGRLGWRLLGIALLVAASTLRFNAFMATVPIALALVPARFRATWPRVIATTLVLSALMMAALPLANRALRAEPSGVALSLVIFDLGGITYHAGHDAFPPLDGIADPVRVNRTCYDPVKWDSYSWWVDRECPIGFYKIQDWFANHHLSPELFWGRAILANPVAYARHRLVHFNIATRFLVHRESEVAGQMTDAPNPWHYHIHRNVVTTLVANAAAALSPTPVEWPIVYIALALGALIMAPGLPSARLIVPLAASSAIYGLGYLLVSVASELRYHLWTMLAAALASVMVAADLVTARQLPWRRAVIAYLPAAIVVLLATGWRLMPA
ncbi:MAG: hypothetical protein B7Y45_06580 [Sphingomonas sp. 28-66-16]|nr:MAG: hypothetical protein B7Y45_06580 [Sphingomonas sp. 28-66-16]